MGNSLSCSELNDTSNELNDEAAASYLSVKTGNGGKQLTQLSLKVKKKSGTVAGTKICVPVTLKLTEFYPICLICTQTKVYKHHVVVL